MYSFFANIVKIFKIVKLLYNCYIIDYILYIFNFSQKSHLISIKFNLRRRQFQIIVSVLHRPNA